MDIFITIWLALPVVLGGFYIIEFLGKKKLKKRLEECNWELARRDNEVHYWKHYALASHERPREVAGRLPTDVLYREFLARVSSNT